MGKCLEGDVRSPSRKFPFNSKLLFYLRSLHPSLRRNLIPKELLSLISPSVLNTIRTLNEMRHRREWDASPRPSSHN
ncbi:hypothetical protein TNCT_300501 [Trichonephila clavata]|uniref:Uncharacterized protein n=1 Tax=Trichonephila clavata TaxID=2740835 RepID=A0A8X6HSP2_TRICU|nr:hypothetical protein TNCT_300501 [Trichonephila clavata]